MYCCNCLPVSRWYNRQGKVVMSNQCRCHREPHGLDIRDQELRCPFIFKSFQISSHHPGSLWTSPLYAFLYTFYIFCWNQSHPPVPRARLTPSPWPLSFEPVVPSADSRVRRPPRASGAHHDAELDDDEQLDELHEESHVDDLHQSCLGGEQWEGGSARGMGELRGVVCGVWGDQER